MTSLHFTKSIWSIWISIFMKIRFPRTQEVLYWPPCWEENYQRTKKGINIKSLLYVQCCFTDRGFNHVTILYKNTCLQFTLEELSLTLVKQLASQVAQMIKNLPAMQETPVQSLVRRIPRRREWLTTSVSLPRECRGQRGLGGYHAVRGVRHEWVTLTGVHSVETWLAVPWEEKHPVRWQISGPPTNV